MSSFDKLAGSLFYKKVKSRSEALDLRDSAKEEAEKGKSVVIFFDNRYHLYLAPGTDPYLVRKEIDQAMEEGISPSSDGSTKTSTKPSKSKSSSVKVKKEDI